MSYEIDRFLPLGAERLLFDYQIARQTETELTLALMALPREFIESWLTLCAATGLKPIAVELASTAAANAFALMGERLPSSWVLLRAGEADFERRSRFLKLKDPRTGLTTHRVADADWWLTDEIKVRCGLLYPLDQPEHLVVVLTTVNRHRAPDIRLPVMCVVERYRKAGRDVSFVSRHVPALPLRPTAIARLVANLGDNPRAYDAPPDEVTISERSGEAVIDVADRGPGVRPEEVERLKQPFTRADDSRARGDGAAGAGLGLAIVDRIARLHGGRFELLPRDGGGTVARVSLPLKG